MNSNLMTTLEMNDLFDQCGAEVNKLCDNMCDEIMQAMRHGFGHRMTSHELKLLEAKLTELYQQARDKTIRELETSRSALLESAFTPSESNGGES